MAGFLAHIFFVPRSIAVDHLSRRQVISISGDGGLQWLMGELLTLKTTRIAGEDDCLKERFACLVELEMKESGFVDFGTDLRIRSSRTIAEGAGIPDEKRRRRNR